MAKKQKESRHVQQSLLFFLLYLLPFQNCFKCILQIFTCLLTCYINSFVKSSDSSRKCSCTWIQCFAVNIHQKKCNSSSMCHPTITVAENSPSFLPIKNTKRENIFFHILRINFERMKKKPVHEKNPVPKFFERTSELIHKRWNYY